MPCDAFSLEICQYWCGSMTCCCHSQRIMLTKAASANAQAKSVYRVCAVCVSDASAGLNTSFNCQSVPVDMDKVLVTVEVGKVVSVEAWGEDQNQVCCCGLCSVADNTCGFCDKVCSKYRITRLGLDSAGACCMSVSTCTAIDCAKKDTLD